MTAVVVSGILLLLAAVLLFFRGAALLDERRKRHDAERSEPAMSRRHAMAELQEFLEKRSFKMAQVLAEQQGQGDTITPNSARRPITHVYYRDPINWTTH